MPHLPIQPNLQGQHSIQQSEWSLQSPTLSHPITQSNTKDSISTIRTSTSPLPSISDSIDVASPHVIEIDSTNKSPYAPPSSLARPKRQIKPTRRLLESLAGQLSNKKSNPKSRHQANVVQLSLDPPQTMQEALTRPDSQQWQEAIKAEFNSLEKNKTWLLTPLPPNRKSISSKWIFKIKTKADGSLDKYKARLVARGFTQIQGIDYTDTFSPVVKLNSIKVLLALATQHNFEIHQLDVKTAFLNGFIEEDIYMSIPEGYSVPSNSDMVCKLKKSLYGLKQSSRAWYQRLDQYLLLHKFQRLESDASIYIKRETQNNFIILTVYVDDCILMSNQLTLIQNLKAILQMEFDMSDEGDLHYTLGNAILRNRIEGWTIIHQQKYLTSKLQDYNMLNCNSVSTPMQSGTHLSKEDLLSSNEDQHLYSQIVGSLMHAIVNTRPDCAYAISTLAQYLSTPADSHIYTLKRTLRYIKGTLSFGIRYQKSPQGDVLHGYSDADWAGCKDTRRSTSGYCFLLAGGVISWGSKKQQSVALSSTESEYMALAKATAEAIWLRRLLQELGFPQTNPTPIYSDSQSAIALTHNPKYHSRSKHIDTQYHFTRDKVIAKNIELRFITTADMTADIFTKSLPRDKHFHCMTKLGMCLVPTPTPNTTFQALLIYTQPLCGSFQHSEMSLSGRSYPLKEDKISKTSPELSKEQSKQQMKKAMCVKHMLPVKAHPMSRHGIKPTSTWMVEFDNFTTTKSAESEKEEPSFQSWDHMKLQGRVMSKNVIRCLCSPLRLRPAPRSGSDLLPAPLRPAPRSDLLPAPPPTLPVLRSITMPLCSRDAPAPALLPLRSCFRPVAVAPTPPTPTCSSTPATKQLSSP